MWMHLVNSTGNSPSPGQPTPGVVKQDKSSGEGGLAPGHCVGWFAFGGAHWPLALAHSDPLWGQTCFGCVQRSPWCCQWIHGPHNPSDGRPMELLEGREATPSKTPALTLPTGIPIPNPTAFSTANKLAAAAPFFFRSRTWGF